MTGLVIVIKIYPLGIIDKAGALVQPLKYTEISEFSEGLLKAEDNYGINRSISLIRQENNST